MNKNLHILTLCLLLTIGKAQVYFNNRYDTHGSCDGAGMIDTFNNQYLTAGFTCSSVSYYAMNLRLYNTFGITTVNRTYHWQGNNFQRGKGFTKQGNKYLLSGTRYYRNDTSLVFQWIFDTNLDSIKYTEYGYLNQGNVIYDILNYHDKDYFMVGQVYDHLYNSEILLIKTDTSGNEIWKKQIGLPGWDEVGYCIKMSSDGNLLVSGNKRTHNSYANNGAYILKLDTAGTVLWERHFPSNHGIPAMGLVELVNGDILVAAARGYGSNLQRPQLIKLDASGNVIFNNVYGITTARAEFYSLIQNDKGNLVAAGQNYYPSQGNYVHGLLYEFNQDGDSLYSREYYIQQYSQNYFRDVVQAPDKGYVFAGYITPIFANGGTGNQDIWLLKTDSSFCTSSSPCGYPTAIEEYKTLEGLSVYPNPANNEVYINFDGESKDAMLSLYDVSGRELQQVTLKSNSKQTINLSSYQSGIYFYKAVSGNKVQQNKLVIIK